MLVGISGAISGELVVRLDGAGFALVSAVAWAELENDKARTIKRPKVVRARLIFMIVPYSLKNTNIIHLFILPPDMSNLNCFFLSLKLFADRPLKIHTDGEIQYGIEPEIRGLQVEIFPDALELMVP